MATCPECDIEIQIDDADLEEMEVGDPWVCDGCASNLRLATLDPLEFDVDEDEEDEEEEEEAADEKGDADDDETGLDDEDEEDDKDDWDE